MISFDRTTKLILGGILILLAIMVFQPRLKTAPEAFAADGMGASVNSGLTYAYKVERISLINTPDKSPVREVFAIPGAACFGVRFDTHIEIYSVLQSPSNTTAFRVSTPSLAGAR